MVDYSEIYDTKVPGFYCEIDNSLASQGLPGKPSVGLFIGQKLSGLLEYNKISGLISSPSQVIPLAGEGSELHRMAEAWFENNTRNKLYIMAVEQTEGQAAVYNLAVTAENAKAGMLNLLIGGRSVKVTINDEDTAAEIATAIKDKINANPMIPATATIAPEKTAEVVLTAKHKGTAGNYIDIRENYYQGEETAAGVALTVTQSKQGSGNADLTDAIAALGDFYATNIVSSYTDAANIRFIKTELTRRFGAMVNMESVFYYVVKGSLSEMLTAVQGVNHQCVCPIMDYKSPNMPEERAARFSAVAAYYFQMDPARQIANLPLTGDLPAAEELRKDERDMLLNAGISTLKTDASGNTVIEREATSYRTNVNGAADESYFDLPSVYDLFYLRYSWKNRFSTKFPRHKLASDGYNVQPGQAIVTPQILTAELCALADDWEAAGLIEDAAGFKQTAITERPADDDCRADQLFRPNLMDNLRIIAGKLQFI